MNYCSRNTWNHYETLGLNNSLAGSLKAQFAVSILDFKGEDVQDKVLRACYNQLEESLIQSNRFTVIDKSQRDEILTSRNFKIQVHVMKTVLSR